MLEAQGNVAVCMIMIRKKKEGGTNMHKRWLTKKNISRKEVHNEEDTTMKVEQNFLEGEEAQRYQALVNGYVLFLHFVMLVNVSFFEFGIHGGKGDGRDRNSSYENSWDVNGGEIHCDCRSYAWILLHLGNVFLCKGSIVVSLGFCILL